MGLSLGMAHAEASQSSSQSLQSSSSATQNALPLANVELSIGMSMQPPFSFLTDSLSEVQGVDVDIIKELQKRTGFKIRGNQISFMHFGELIELGRNGKMDIIAGGITLSDSRRAFFEFSEPHLAVPLVLVARSNDNIQDIPDLKNRTLAVENGSMAADFIPNANELNIGMTKTTSLFMSMYAVHTNKADAVAVDEPMARFYIENWNASNLEVVRTLSQPSALGFLFKKNSDFNPHLQAAFNEMLEDGTITRIFDKYMGTEMTDHYMTGLKHSRTQSLSLNQVK